MDPAWERLKAQKPYVGVVVTGSAEAVPYFENGQVWISPYWSGRSGYYIDRGLPFDMLIPQEGVIGLFDCRRRAGRREEQEARLRVPQLAARPRSPARFPLAYFTSPGRGDITDWPPEFAAARSSPEQMAKVQFPDCEVIGQRAANGP